MRLGMRLRTSPREARPAIRLALTRARIMLELRPRPVPHRGELRQVCGSASRQLRACPGEADLPFSEGFSGPHESTAVRLSRPDDAPGHLGIHGRPQVSTAVVSTALAVGLFVPKPSCGAGLPGLRHVRAGKHRPSVSVNVHRWRRRLLLTWSLGCSRVGVASIVSLVAATPEWPSRVLIPP